VAGVAAGRSAFQPAVTGSTVAVVAGSLTGKRFLAGLDARSGEERWRVDVARTAGQPVAANGLIVVPGPERVEAYAAADGALRWVYADARATSRGITTAPMVAAGELLLLPVGAWDGGAAQLRAARAGAREWRAALGVRAAGGGRADQGGPGGIWQQRGRRE
jgi:outer membrane protein assembly factor BamB